MKRRSKPMSISSNRALRLEVWASRACRLSSRPSAMRFTRRPANGSGNCRCRRSTSRDRPEIPLRLAPESNCRTRFASLPSFYSRAKLTLVRFLTILLATLLLPLSFGASSVTTCSTPACCGANCSPSAPVSQVNCCKAPVAPDRATSQAQDAHHFDSIGRIPVAGVAIAISHLQNTVVARGYPPPDRPDSLALLCSRQI